MWGSFALGGVLCVLFVFLPGFLLFRGVGIPTVRSVVLAPLFSAALYPICGIVFDKLGVSASWSSFFAIALGAGILLFAIGSIVRWTRKEKLRTGVESDADARCEYLFLGLYLGIGCVATLVIFVLNLDGADSFIQEYDNVYHLATIRTFIETGNWSGLTSSFYSASDPASLNPIPSFGFYPASWHSIVAMVATCGGVPVAVAVNAVNAVLCALVFPSGVYLVMRLLFKRDRSVRVVGAFVAFTFAAFPWKLLAWGPIFPNYAALCLTPSLIASFVGFFESGLRLGDRVRWGIGVVVGLVAVVFMQTNVVFTSVVFLAPFCVSRLYGWVFQYLSKTLSLAVCALFCIFVLVVWAIMFNLPFLQELVTFGGWPAFVGKIQAVMNVLMLSFRETPAQLVLAACVISGAILVVRRRRNAWLVVSYVLMCLMYVVCASTDGFLKQFLTGFWYADPMRMAANAALFAIPLASVGLAGIVSTLGGWLHDRYSASGTKRLTIRSGKTLVAIVSVVCLFFPSFSIPGKFDVETGIGYSRSAVASAYNASRPNILNPEEKDFVEKVCEIVPDGSVVINEPNDGSAFAYGLYGLDVYYRSMNQYGGDNETAESELIRTELDKYFSDADVRKAVDTIGADYVLQLDQNDSDRVNRYIDFAYFPEQWEGIDEIDDHTAGFEVVLSEGDMRLYRIVR